MFGEPRRRPETEAAGTRASVPTAGDVTGGVEVIALLRQQVEAAERREREATERAERYERERDELRVKLEGVLSQLLPPPAHVPAAKRPGFLGRLFGG